MKRTILSITTVMLIIIMSLMCLTACGGSDGSSDAAEAAESETSVAVEFTEEDGIVGGDLEDGTYKMTKLFLDGDDATEMIEQLDTVGMDLELVVKGTDIKMINNEYKLVNGTFVGADDTITYAVNGTTVTVIDSDNSKMIYEKQ